MNVLKFLDEFTTESLMEHKTSRRNALGIIGAASKKLTLATIPIGLAMKTKAEFAIASQNDLADILQFALTLEYVQEEFYRTALDCNIFYTFQPQNLFNIIAQHQTAHINYITTTLIAAGAEPVEKPEYDFTAGGLFDPFNGNGIGRDEAYTQFLTLSQAFEDIGVRAYKNQIPNLYGSDFLSPALQIQSVEARHAATVRKLRAAKGWITGKERGEGMPEVTQAVYNGEENVHQLGVNVTTLGEGSPFGVDAATEAYDEPLAKEDVLAYLSLFIKS